MSAAQDALCVVSLDVHSTLKLRQRPKQVKHQFATAGGRIEVLLETLEANPALRQVRDDLDEMPERTPKAVELPDHQHIALAQVGEQVL
jgi:hypothetical protein